MTKLEDAPVFVEASHVVDMRTRACIEALFADESAALHAARMLEGIGIMAEDIAIGHAPAHAHGHEIAANVASRLLRVQVDGETWDAAMVVMSTSGMIMAPVGNTGI